MSPPPCRCLLITAAAFRPEADPAGAADSPTGVDGWSVSYRMFPVVAFEAVAVASYSRLLPLSGSDLPADPANHQEATRAGWRHSGTEIRRAAIFLDDDGQLTDLSHHGAMFSVDTARLVVCHWPVADDDARLAPIREAMRPRAIDHARRVEALSQG